MKPSTAILLLGLTSLASAAFAETIPASGDARSFDAIVGVYARHSGGKFVYHYRVTNKSQQNIIAVTVGRDNQNDANPNNDINELLDLPSFPFSFVWPVYFHFVPMLKTEHNILKNCTIPYPDHDDHESNENTLDL